MSEIAIVTIVAIACAAAVFAAVIIMAIWINNHYGQGTDFSWTNKVVGVLPIPENLTMKSHRREDVDWVPVEEILEDIIDHVGHDEIIQDRIYQVRFGDRIVVINGGAIKNLVREQTRARGGAQRALEKEMSDE